MKKTVNKLGDLEIQVVIQAINLFWLKFGSILVKITKVQTIFFNIRFHVFQGWRGYCFCLLVKS